MEQAAQQWYSAGLGVRFQETRDASAATFTVLYSPGLHDHYATVFLPGDANRIMKIGAPMLKLGSNVSHITNILSHKLGHVLGLRHDSWEAAGENKLAPAWYYPTKELNDDSVMNSFNVRDLSILVVGSRDRENAKRFYRLEATTHGDIEIVDLDP
jgi:hypothetical protein